MVDLELHDLIAKGKAQGYLTYDQVNAYLPDEAVNPEKLDNLLIALEDMGIELVSEAPTPEASADGVMEDIVRIAPQKKVMGDTPRWSDDPVRLYLPQI